MCEALLYAVITQQVPWVLTRNMIMQAMLILDPDQAGNITLSYTFSKIIPLK